MNDLQCNEFYNVVIDAVLTLYGADIVWVRAGQIYWKQDCPAESRTLGIYDNTHI